MSSHFKHSTKNTDYEDLLTIVNTFDRQIFRYRQNPRIDPIALNLMQTIAKRLQDAAEAIVDVNDQYYQSFQINSKQIQLMRDTITRLEAICLIHGIDDLAAWMAKDTGALVDDVRFNQKFNLTQIPIRLIENRVWRKFYDEQMLAIQQMPAKN